MLNELLSLIREASPGATLSVAGFLALVSGGAALRLLLAAIREAGLTELQACQEMGLDQAQWHRQKSGEAHVSLQRASLLPPQVLALWGQKLALEYGTTAEFQRQAALYTALLRKRRMLRAQLAREEVEAVS